MKQITEQIVAPPRGLTKEYGEYVAMHASLCSDCHTPRSLKTGEFCYDSLLAGSTVRFGADSDDPVLSFAPNLTPGPETGIGRWTEIQFLLLLRTGMGPDGRVRTHHMPNAYLWTVGFNSVLDHRISCSAWQSHDDYSHSEEKMV